MRPVFPADVAPRLCLGGVAVSVTLSGHQINRLLYARTLATWNMEIAQRQQMMQSEVVRDVRGVLWRGG